MSQLMWFFHDLHGPLYWMKKISKCVEIYDYLILSNNLPDIPDIQGIVLKFTYPLSIKLLHGAEGSGLTNFRY